MLCCLQLHLLDPVTTVSLTGFVKQKLAECRDVFGTDHFKALMETMDSVIANQLVALIS